MGFEPIEALPFKKDFPFKKGKDPVDAVKESRLSCPIRADEADNLALRDGKAYPFKGIKPSKGFRH
jgi:hypothetical protein